MLEASIAGRSRDYLAGLNAGRRIASLTRATLAKLFRAAPADRCLSIEERLAIGQKKELILVNCGGRRFLMATASDSIAQIIEVPVSIDASCSDNVTGCDRREGGL